MVSVGPDTQACNFTHMYSFTDYRNSKENEIPKVEKESIYDYIDSQLGNPFSKFKMIIQRAKSIGLLNDIQANCTVLIPPDKYLQHIPNDYFLKMDDGLARQILASSIIDRKICKALITSSPVSYYITRNPKMRMYITNISNKCKVNNCAEIIKFDIECNNGLIHIVNGLIAPNEDHFMN